MKWPSRYVLKRTTVVTLIAATISISISTGIRLVIGAEADTVTIIVRVVLPFVIAVPLALVWFSGLEQLDNSYRSLLKEANELVRHASTDPLTGLLNRRSFAEQFNAALAHGIKGVFLIADVDYLKAINDQHGHLVGDDAIVASATALQAVLGEESLIARVGGDEFCAFLAERDVAEIERMIEQINKVATEGFRERTGFADFSLSISTAYSICKRGETFRSMVARTDSSLYRMKREREAV